MSNSWVSASQEKKFFKAVELFSEKLVTELVNEAVRECCLMKSHKQNRLKSTHQKPGNFTTLIHSSECSFLLNIARQEIIFSVK